MPDPTINGNPITDPHAFNGLKKILDNNWFASLHNGDSDFTEEELQKILNQATKRETKPAFDQKDQEILYNIDVFSAEESYGLANEFVNRFGNGTRMEVKLPTLLQKTPTFKWHQCTDAFNKCEKEYSKTWQKFFDKEFMEYFAFLSFEELDLSTEPDLQGVETRHNRDQVLEKARELGGVAFEAKLKNFFNKVRDFIQNQPQSEEDIINRTAELNELAHSINDQYFVPHGFFFHIIPGMGRNSGTNTIYLTYEKGNISNIHHFPNPFVEGGSIRVFYFRGGFSTLENKMLDNDQVTLPLSQATGNEESFRKSLTGISGPRINLDEVLARREEIKARHADYNYEYQFLLQRAFGSTPPRDGDLNTKIAMAATANALRHTWDVLEVGDDLANREFTSEVSSLLAELALAPEPFASLERIFALSFKDGPTSPRMDCLITLGLLGGKLGVFEDGKEVFEGVSYNGGTSLRDVKAFRFKETRKQAFIERLKTISESELRQAAREAYTALFGSMTKPSINVLPKNNAFKATHIEKFKVR